MHGLRKEAGLDLERAVSFLLLFAEKLIPQFAQPPLPLNRQRLNVLRFVGAIGVLANALRFWENRADARRMVGSVVEGPLRPRHVTSASQRFVGWQGSRKAGGLQSSDRGCHGAKSLQPPRHRIGTGLGALPTPRCSCYA